MNKLDFPPEVIDLAYDFEFETHMLQADEEIAGKDGVFCAVGIFSIVLKPCFPSHYVHIVDDPLTNNILVVEDEFDLRQNTYYETYEVAPIRIPVEVGRTAYIKIRSQYLFNPYFVTDYMQNVIGLRDDTFDYIRMRVYERLLEESIFHER